MDQSIEAPLQLARHFRQILDAMARPGRLVEITGVEGVDPLDAATCAAISVLSDSDAPVWLAPGLRQPGVERFLRFETGNAPVTDPAVAAFLVGDWEEISGIDIPLGFPEFPDRSATLILAVPHLEAGHGIALSGPGIEHVHHVECGLPADFWAARAENHALYPLGWDVLLTCGARLAALPRTTKTEG